MNSEIINQLLDPMSEPISLLGLKEDYSSSDVNVQYRKMARLTHPDLHKNNSKATDAFNRLTDARDYLLFMVGESIEHIDNNYYWKKNQDVRPNLPREKTSPVFDPSTADHAAIVEEVDRILYGFCTGERPLSPAFNRPEVINQFIMRFPQSIDEPIFGGDSTLLSGLICFLSFCLNNSHAPLLLEQDETYKNYKSLANKLINMGSDPFIGSTSAYKAINRMVEGELWDLFNAYIEKNNKDRDDVLCNVIENTDDLSVARNILKCYQTKKLKTSITNNTCLIPALVERGLLEQDNAEQLICEKISTVLRGVSVYRALPESYRVQTVFIVAMLSQLERQKTESSKAGLNIPVNALSKDLVKALVYLYPRLSDEFLFRDFKPVKKRMIDAIAEIFLVAIVGSLLLASVITLEHAITVAALISCATYAGVFFTASIALYFFCLATAVIVDYISFKFNPEAIKIEEIKTHYGIFNELKPTQNEEALSHEDLVEDGLQQAISSTSM